MNSPTINYKHKINQIISSICKMSSSTVQKQLGTCHHIIAQLLNTQIIYEFQSLDATKLLVYELILLMAEENSQKQRTILPPKSKKRSSLSHSKKLKHQPEDQNLQTVQQLQNIIKKKEKRIKELSHQLSQTLQQQKELQDLNEQLQNSNIILTEKVKNMSLDLELQSTHKQQPQNFHQFSLNSYEQNEHRTSSRKQTNKKYKGMTQTPITSLDESSLSNMLQNEMKNKENSQFYEEPNKENDNSQTLYRLLLIQSNSIQAMI